LDPNVLTSNERNHASTLSSSGTSDPTAPPLSHDNHENDPVIGKYVKLLKMGMPLEQVQLKMKASGIDPGLLGTTSTTATAAVTSTSLSNTQTHAMMKKNGSGAVGSVKKVTSGRLSYMKKTMNP
jgi:hypothetical protein